jgi:hypothetical protein
MFKIVIFLFTLNPVGRTKIFLGRRLDAPGLCKLSCRFENDQQQRIILYENFQPNLISFYSNYQRFFFGFPIMLLGIDRKAQ